MNTQENPDEIVDECIERLSRNVPQEKLSKVLAQVVNALWIRSSRTLSEITIDAIFDRALYLSKDSFPILASIKFDRGVAVGDIEIADSKQLIAAYRYFLVMILNLVGNLTSDILLDGLYRELRSFLLEDPKAVAAASSERSKQLDKKQKELKSMKAPIDLKGGIPKIPRILTHISNLDEILGGGLPEGTITIIAGSPGTGKTILSQQICFPNATSDSPVLFFQTLSEPTAKTLKYLSQFKFFDPGKIANDIIEFIDLGGILKLESVQEGIDQMMEHVKRVKPSFVVIDSFKVFEDLAKSREELRKFTYGVAVNLMAWECTTLLLGEFNDSDLESNPLFSIVDGVIKLKIKLESGEQQRFIQVVKMRGTNHSRDEHAMSISEDGIGVYAPRVTIRREADEHGEKNKKGPDRAKLGISKMDDLLGEGVPFGSSFLLSGVAGTGKTLLSLEFLYRGAKDFGERGIYFSFEETDERLLAEARGMGWEIDQLIDSGMIEIIFIAQPDIVVEKHLLMMNERITKLKAKRIVIDSVSLFVHKISDQQIVREKVFQLATLVQKAHGIGFFITDIPYGSNKLSRFGVEETVVDGVILLTSSEKDFERERFIEIYKLRNTAHMDGRHEMKITSNGILITPRQILDHDEKQGTARTLEGVDYGEHSDRGADRAKDVPPARDPLRH
ncbi:MAG: hypothetical protein H7281_18735 [Bacteriovorax sp.]|nr:hypothetical protein [Bacteriovorax sp.]